MVDTKSAVVELALLYRYLLFVYEILNNFQHQRQLFTAKTTAVASGLPPRTSPCALNNSLINSNLPFSALLYLI